MSEFANVLDLIDSERYPIDAPDGAAGRALIAHCRAQMKARGSCELPGFLRPAAIAAMAGEAEAVAPLAHRTRDSRGTAYLAAPDETLAADHPRRRLQTTSVGAVAYDLIPKHHLVRRLYEWDGLTRFLALALDKPELFHYGDPMGALNIAAMGAGEHLLWHFDQTDFVVSLMLQSAPRGGAFEYVPYIRTLEAENYDRVRRLLDGDRGEVIELDLAPGTLALFEGRYSIHRVSPIEGERLRLIALLGYDAKPGVMSSDLLRQRRYGRTATVVQGLSSPADLRSGHIPR